MTYSELSKTSGILAKGLKLLNMGIQHGDRIAVVAGNLILPSPHSPYEADLEVLAHKHDTAESWGHIAAFKMGLEPCIFMSASLTTDAYTLFIKSMQLCSLQKTQVNHFRHFRFRFRPLRRPLPEAAQKASYCHRALIQRNRMASTTVYFLQFRFQSRAPWVDMYRPAPRSRLRTGCLPPRHDPRDFWPTIG